MKFKVKGTKTTLEPKDKLVVASYLARPDTYEPADAEAKKAAEKRSDLEGGGDDGAGTGQE